MSSVVLSKSAVNKLMNDPALYQWRGGAHNRRVPFLGYFRRSYTTLHDGTVIDHGDGFMLTTIDPDDVDETEGIVLRSVPVSAGLHILVGGNNAIMSDNFTIGWSDCTFTREPLIAS